MFFRTRVPVGLVVVAVSKITPAHVARQAGFVTALPHHEWFKVEPSLRDREPVGLILRIRRSRHPGQFVFSVRTDGDAVHVPGTGIAGDIEKAVVTALVMHEKHELGKEAP